jgi:hypothetical protein
VLQCQATRKIAAACDEYIACAHDYDNEYIACAHDYDNEYHACAHDYDNEYHVTDMLLHVGTTT